jgi:prephenate dehydratase
MPHSRPRIAFQGERGAFSELAVRHWWNGSAEPLPCPTFEALVAAVVDGHADAGVLPVENRIVGEVTAARTALAAAGARLRIVSHVTVPVRMALMAHAGTTLAMVRAVRSHPVALAQCAAYLARLGAAPEEALDTAGAARELAESPAPHVAVLAPAPAADRYGLVVLADGVQDAPDNWTRFARIERVDG